MNLQVDLVILLLICFDYVEPQTSLAQFGTASQSTTKDDWKVPLPANLAIIGGPTNNFYSESCTHTKETEIVAWWMLAFPAITYVTNIKIFYRYETLDRLAGYYLYISNTSEPKPNGHLCYHDKGPEIPSMNQTVDCYTLGQYIIFFNNRTDVIPSGYSPKAIIELCDVQVYGCNKTWYGDKCQHRCSIKCFDQHCFPENGSCIWGCNCIGGTCTNSSYCSDGCKGGYGGPYCTEYNLASNKTALLVPLPLNQNPILAIDGNRTKLSCIRTNGSLFQVDLGRLYVIKSIQLTFYTDVINENQPVHNDVYITNTSGLWSGAIALTQNKSHSFPSSVYDIDMTICRYVSYVQSAVREDNSTVDFCEMEIIGCPMGKYGVLCDKDCPPNCAQYCHLETGLCHRGCKDGWIGSECTDPCSEGRFGAQCAQTCNCVKQPCDHINGTCPTGGCTPGYKGSNCSTECSSGNYGRNCEESCDGCLSNLCDKKDGNCTNTTGCNPGWQYGYPKCNIACSNGSFGAQCAQTCNCVNQPCNKINGTCPAGGCTPGYKGSNCATECSSGNYGKNCEESCVGCLSNSCDTKDGNCTNTTGCNPGWQYGYPKCNIACRGGSFGNNCSQLCHCADQSCNHINGVCPLGGCQRGYEGTTCSTECRSGTYGFNCNSSCSGCALDSCDTKVGVCTNKTVCKPGWHSGVEFKCDLECDHGTYGYNCSKECMTCELNSCSKIDGNCTYGCKNGYTGNLCLGLLSSPEQAASNTGHIGGGITAAVIVIFIISVVIILMRRRLQKKKENENKPEKTLESSYVSNEVRDTKERSHDYVNIAAADQNDVEISIRSNDKTLRKQYYNEFSKHLSDEEDITNVYNNVTSVHNTTEHKIAVTELQNVINLKLMQNDFEKEYKILPKGLVRPHITGSLEENKAKNRYLTTWPYDHSRVILQGNDGDYINASYIDSYSKAKAYIATQGPKKNTIRDFWQMIWQENVNVIVMLTQLVEEKKKKCDQYWPMLTSKPLELDHFRISLSEETLRTVYVYRAITLFNKETKSERTVKHFHFTQWPDHGVPDQIKVVTFYRKVKNAATAQTGPMVVHCSAGVGRTGTFIAIDALYKNGQQTGYVDVMEYVQIMRKDRMNMIQSKEQYATVFEALLEVFTVPHTSIDTETILANLENNKTRQSQEYKKLIELKPTYPEKDFKASKAKENWSKNAVANILPHDQYRPFLTSFERQRNNYINAVIIPEYVEERKYLVTHYPLLETVVDFWTMVYDYNCGTVVLLESYNDNTSLWPTSNGEFDFEIFSLTTEKESFPIQVTLKHKVKRDRKTVSVLSIDEWSPDNVPSSTKCMLDVLDSVLTQPEQLSGAITVVCRDGCSRSGLFVALALILKKMRMDDEVDIFQVVRAIQKRRSECLSTFEQYDYCYRFIQHLFEENSLYANI